MNSFLGIISYLQIDEKQKAPKVQLNIASRDGEISSANRSARAPNVNVKTPIVVKRIEPGKQPVVSDPVYKPHHQVS